MAHEVGHNMGRQHSPCGGAGSPDPSYPYAGGGIGIYGLDLATLSLKLPGTYKDFMGYCNPSWVSDYTWSGMVSYRQTNPNYAPPIAAGSTAGGLLVWGRIGMAGVVLEPAFRVSTPPTPPAASSAYRVEGLAADGRLLFSLPIEPVHTMTQQAGMSHEQHFAVVVPLGPAADQLLARLRLVGPGVLAERVSLQASAAAGRTLFLSDPAAALSRPNAVHSRITWDGATYPVALVRDAATGEVLSFARGGAATVWTGSRRVVVTFSDGVRSLVKALP
jgi:hypothetical protein